ncbi:hypothetical protein [Clostridium felsineum]|uniref:hypothetical protein n=1 Tax=Clostridium felsineum TaxID=36839 RepID=UPI00098C35CC|nr:hypothetical protein [Clostridium felsineum]URZ16708.1 hypothetical protein CLFE_027550 [Clostridium felsineum DSM 794]
MESYKSILANLINQNPSKSFIAACNKYINWINNNVVMESICLLNNNECNSKSESKNKAIDSHLVSKGANLKPISKNGKVRTIEINYKNPINNELKETGIKKATTFPGFCKYHDNLIFMPLEKTKIDIYTNEHTFLLILRVVAYKRYQSQKKYKQTSLIIQSFNNEIVKNMLKESTIHKVKIDSVLSKKSTNKFKAIWCFIKTNFTFRYSIKGANKINCEDYTAFDQLSKKLINMLQKEDYSEIVFKQFTIREKKIAFSSAYNIPLKKNNLFVFLFVLPDNKKSNILIACLKKDFALLMKDSKIRKCFDGDVNQIQELINIDSGSIVFNGDDDDFNDYEYAKYIYESDDQIKELFPPHILK